MAKLQFFNRYNPKPMTEGISFKGQEEVCNQQLAEECEIRTIIEQFETGKIQDLPAVRQPVYNDLFITPQSYNDALAMVDKVKSDFYNLPVETQRKFGDISTYLNDLYQISNGDKDILAKYKGFNVASPETVSQREPVAIENATADSSSSSLSRGDTKSAT